MSISKSLPYHRSGPAGNTPRANDANAAGGRQRPTQFEMHGRRLIRSPGEPDLRPQRRIQERAARALEAAAAERENPAAAAPAVATERPEDLHRSVLDPFFTPQWVVVERANALAAQEEREGVGMAVAAADGAERPVAAWVPFSLS
jgi:hypothetical protein